MFDTYRNKYDNVRMKREDGILEVSLQYFRGETGAFYETDLDKVLAGEAILPPMTEGAAESA